MVLRRKREERKMKINEMIIKIGREERIGNKELE